MARGTLTLRAKEIVVDSPAQWAARHGATPVEALLCTGALGCPTAGPHVHARRDPSQRFRVDPRTGRWIRPGEPVGA